MDRRAFQQLEDIARDPWPLARLLALAWVGGLGVVLLALAAVGVFL